MKVTVIIPTYNRVQSLGAAIRSVLRQGDAAELDILVIDDGSTDTTPELLNQMSQQHNNLRVIRQNNQGVTVTRNTGLANIPVDADIVTFLDSDDILLENRFAEDLPYFIQNPDLEITYGRMIMVDGLDLDELTIPPHAQQIELTPIQLSCALFRPSLLARIGEFDTSLKQAEDTDYLLRIFESNTNFLQTTTVCLCYLRHPGNMTKDIAEAKHYFAKALYKSIKRRKADPTIKLIKPNFELEPIKDVNFV